MDELIKEKEFEILGYNIQLKSGTGEQNLSPAQVVEYVDTLTRSIHENAPHLERGEIAVLAALQIAGEKLNGEFDFKANLDKLQSTATDALQFIEEVSPTTV